MRYLALFRGMNVGGHGIVKMADLKRWFEEAGFTDVSTHIQSGNVLFTAPQTPLEKLAMAIEAKLAAEGPPRRVIVLDSEALAEVLAESPFPAGQVDRAWFVVFVDRPIEGEVAASTPRGDMVLEGVGRRAFYCRGVPIGGAIGDVNKLLPPKHGLLTTARNWGVTQKLYELLTG